MSLQSKNPAAVELGRKGGIASSKKLTAEERRARATNAIKARWDKRALTNTKE